MVWGWHVEHSEGTCWGTGGRCLPGVSDGRPKPFGRRTQALNAHDNCVIVCFAIIMSAITSNHTLFTKIKFHPVYGSKMTYVVDDLRLLRAKHMLIFLLGLQLFLFSL